MSIAVSDEDLPFAEEIEEETSPHSTLTIMLTAFLETPGVTPACAIMDYLDENGRSDDSRAFRLLLSRFCSKSKNGTMNPDYEWRLTREEIITLFWFDLNGRDDSLSRSFGSLGRTAQGVTGGSTFSFSSYGPMPMTGLSTGHPGLTFFHTNRSEVIRG